eukprot:CAMPEP_0176357120 /NCGR_PEP_ID=MMETSP0126-20121128/14537_1 /TAXON_ID=141414 ORGANISM="Strombidinopsis acuminatum, Strain SPMC142" /NCGR_SAMPLE_ID=MMETSP0126 /ASSEMBLY_ACC=CAM_ASM_000229 /LENGTH=83 /DNA_ID=CAMNT_0017710573 /DNA_START=1582 /DNA_END=1833 /DNA_ORIENTATION=+
MSNECKQGLNIMKYALNHPTDFKNPVIVWLIGFMQFFMVVFVELVNILVICGQDKVYDCIVNFIALGIIADFDDAFFRALPKH